MTESEQSRIAATRMKLHPVDGSADENREFVASWDARVAAHRRDDPMGSADEAEVRVFHEWQDQSHD